FNRSLRGDLGKTASVDQFLNQKIATAARAADSVDPYDSEMIEPRDDASLVQESRHGGPIALARFLEHFDRHRTIRGLRDAPIDLAGSPGPEMQLQHKIAVGKERLRVADSIRTRIRRGVRSRRLDGRSRPLTLHVVFRFLLNALCNSI